MFTRNVVQIALSFCLCLGSSLSVQAADVISANGYSGLGLVPSAQVLTTGAAVLNFDTALPGIANTAGYNNQVGFGVYDHLELVGRLATNDLRCNMFRAGNCPPNSLRDFAVALKWSLPFEWLKNNNAHFAVGVTDAGGAASYFKSYYVVASKSFDKIDLTLGRAQAKAPYAILDGNFGAITWNVFSWSQLSLQRIGGNSWAHAALTLPITDTGISAWFNYNRRLSDTALTQKQWTGFGISLPLDSIQKAKPASAPAPSRLLAKITPSELVAALNKNGFYNPRIGKAASGAVVVELENTAYHGNTLDAAGVALGLVAAAHAEAGQYFELIISSRGIRQLLIRANAACVKKWLEADDWCDRFEIKSLNNKKYDDSEVAWSEGSRWHFRPEIILTPTLISTIGTEYGVLDLDLGMNVNTVLPLWQGAYTDVNHIHPLDYRTANFEPGGPFYASRLRSVTSRRMLHQLLSFPSVNTQMRLSAGMAYNVWDGKQIETNSQSGNGRHKLTLTAGSFKNDQVSFNNEKQYHLLNYRYVYDDAQKTSTELTNGRFWGGDNGFLLGQKFWHGDTTLQVYIKRSRMSEAQPLVSFAGIQFITPLSGRKSSGFEHFALRGGNQWTYTIESKINANDNRLTAGYGEIPKIGDPLVQTFNRDRNSSAYYESSTGRIKNAFVNLTTAD